MAKIMPNGNLNFILNKNGGNQWLQDVIENAEHADFDVIEKIIENYEVLAFNCIEHCQSK